MHELPFDRISGNKTGLSSILYADITHPQFKKWHETLRGTAEKGQTSYRVRHKPSKKPSKAPLAVNGYGVALQLKRTDYIVIDDRNAEDKGRDAAQKPIGTKLDDEEAELKPLAKDELADLGLKAADFAMKSEKPLDTLLKLSQDFPRYSSIIADHKVSDEFTADAQKYSEKLPPAGYNMLWINGVQMPTRDLNPYSLLTHLRRERKLIDGIREQGLSGFEVISLLSHDALAQSTLR